MEKIVSVAIIHKGLIISLPAPNRHGDVIALMSELYEDVEDLDIQPQEQGFLTSSGRFVNREDAALIAFQACQSINRSQKDFADLIMNRKLSPLFSEDIF